MKKYLIYILLISSWVSAQQDAYFSLLEYQMTLVNPAYAGAEGNQILSNSINVKSLNTLLLFS